MIHPTAIIGKHVELGQNVTIGPYAVIDGEAIAIGDNCKIGPHCQVTGYTTIGSGTTIHHGAVIGDLPQDYDFHGAVSYCRIGSDCIIREYVTIHRGTKDQTSTVIGNGCMLMGFVHIAHNCNLADRVIIANGSMLAGYVEVGFRAFISSMTGIHQFVRIGTVAMVSAHGHISQDVAPYCTVSLGDRIYGPNVVGLRRAGFDQETRNAIKDAIKLLFFSGLLHQEALSQIEQKYPGLEPIRAFVEFARTSKRGLTAAH